MPHEPRTSPIVPNYGENTLADLSASLLATLTGDTAGNVLRLPPASRACLLVIDGLGWELLRAHQAAAPFLAELAFNSVPLSCGFPATTVTSIASLGTALPPGSHGMLGYAVADPATGSLLNGLDWPPGTDPVAWQPRPTVFERALAAGVRAAYVAPAGLDRTGLSRAASRGPEFRGVRSLGGLAHEALQALSESERSLVTVYHPDLDAAGHVYGTASDAWAFQLAHVDRLAEQIAGSLPPGGVLYVTGDHGMVDAGADDRIDIDATPALMEGVAMLGGDTRARYLYAAPGQAAAVLARWQEILGDRAWVVSRDEAVKDGWFGPVEPEFAARIGDVIAAAAGNTALIASRAEPMHSRLIGMHGSLTAAEQLVPLLAYTAR
jgi:predicted AlkP superfamily pyrophosphatase or phosphodiesterase